jgi:FixJ family two-component response regulator
VVSGAAEERSSAARTRILIFDDDTVFRRALARFLCAADFEVVAFAAAEYCVTPPGRCACGDGIRCMDIILTDLEMPGVNGADFLRSLVASGCRCPHVAILTGLSLSRALPASLPPVVRVFTKPVDWAALTEWLNSCRRTSVAARRLSDTYLRGPARRHLDPI